VIYLVSCTAIAVFAVLMNSANAALALAAPAEPASGAVAEEHADIVDAAAAGDVAP
jgi:hypothetical protein